MWKFDGIEFADPNALWALVLLPIIAIIRIVRWNKSTGEMKYVSSPGKSSWSLANLRPHLFWLGWLALGCWIIAFARPRSQDVNAQLKGMDGIDIMLAVDISASMLSKDLRPSRIEALKVVAENFIENRPNDRIGLVAYAGSAFTATPLTTDHEITIESLKELSYDLLDGGTAIGMGLATAVNRLHESEAKSRVIILMTDGENTGGEIDPLSAAAMAKTVGVRVYTIGIGSKGWAESPAYLDRGRIVYRRSKVSIDENLLKEIAADTDGKYFRATDEEELQNIYEEIDQLEKSKIEEVKYVQYHEHFYPFAIIGLVLLALEHLLKNSLFRSVV